MKITKNNISDIYKATQVSVETMQLRGYELIEELFVDNSGFGSPDEPAYTQSGFMSKVEAILTDNPEVYATLTGVGQFQVYVGLFKKTGKKTSIKIGNNTYRVELPNGYAIRLHNTNVLTFEADHVTLDSGGWHTATTKARINEYLPAGVRISQENFDWFVIDNRDGTKKPFVDGMTIAS